MEEMYNFTGQTALITGASSGLGVEFAQALASRGANLVLVARRQDRLRAVASEIKKQFGVSVTVISRDLSAPRAGAVLLSDIARRGIQLDVVVNNAGFGTYGPLQGEDPDRIADEVALNVGAVVDISRAALPGMLARNIGAIINVASTADFQPLSNFATYAATKAFVLSFTEALWGETEHTGVRVLALCPGATATEFFEVAGSDAITGPLAPASDVIAAALRGLDRRQPSVIHGSGNRFAPFAMRFFSRKFVIRLARRVMSRNRPNSAG
jgi:short-subunit dehydrogenase